nr:hypothetical protein [Pseudomonas syringae pv. theae]
MTACIFPPAISLSAEEHPSSIKASKLHNPCISDFLIMNFTALNLPDHYQTKNSTATGNSGGAQALAMRLLFTSDIRLAPSFP